MKYFLLKGGRLPQDETAPLSQVIGSYFVLRAQNLNLRALSLTMNGSFKQLLHKYQLLFGVKSKTDPGSQPSCD